MLKHVLCQAFIYGGKPVSKERPIRSTNNGDMAEKAKRPVSESVTDIYLITEKLSF